MAGDSSPAGEGWQETSFLRLRWQETSSCPTDCGGGMAGDKLLPYGVGWSGGAGWGARATEGVDSGEGWQETSFLRLRWQETSSCPTDSGQALPDADSRLRREWQAGEDAEGDREVAGRTRLPQGRRAGNGRARRAGACLLPCRSPTGVAPDRPVTGQPVGQELVSCHSFAGESAHPVSGSRDARLVARVRQRRYALGRPWQETSSCPTDSCPTVCLARGGARGRRRGRAAMIQTTDGPFSSAQGRLCHTGFDQRRCRGGAAENGKGSRRGAALPAPALRGAGVTALAAAFVQGTRRAGACLLPFIRRRVSAPRQRVTGRAAGSACSPEEMCSRQTVAGGKLLPYGLEAHPPQASS